MLALLCLLWITAACHFHVTWGVKIEPSYTAIEWCGTQNVTLPCMYTSNSNTNTQIEWYKEHPNGREQVMRVSSNGGILRGRNFTNRVDRGESASMVLKKPKHTDSGSYICEVMNTEDVPFLATGKVNLTVKKNCGKQHVCNECLTGNIIITFPFTDPTFCANGRDITLSCPYERHSNVTVQIEWYLHHHTGREIVMRVSPDGTITAGRNFTGRVAKSGNASLILKNPGHRDAGLYICEVASTQDDRCCATAFVNITISDCTSGTDLAVPLVFCLLDVITVCYCIVAIAMNCRRKNGKRSTKVPYVHLLFIYMPGLRFGVVNASAAVLCCLGVILLSVHMGTTHSDGMRAAGVIFTLFGIVTATLSFITLRRHRLRRSDRRCPCHHLFRKEAVGDDVSVPLEEDCGTHFEHNEDAHETAGLVHEVPSGYDTLIKKTSDDYRLYCNELTDGWLVNTVPCIEASKALERCNSILLNGGPADGKSFVLWHLVTSTEYLPVQCGKPSDVESYMDKNKGNDKLMFVIDDAFGRSFVQWTLVDEWINAAEKLQIHLRSHKFVFATRSTVWADCKKHLENIAFFSDIVEVTSAKLTVDDKRELISKYLADPRLLTHDDMEYIVHTTEPIAYVQCCKLMADALVKGKSSRDVVDIFDRPMLFLRSELQKMADKEQDKYSTLCLIMLCGGKLPCRELSGALSQITTDVRMKLSACDFTNESVVEIRRCAEKMSDTYLEKVMETGADLNEIEMYRFTHKSVFEAVILEYGEHHLRQFLNHHMAVQIVRPQSFLKREQACVINVPEDYYTDVAKLFTDACIAGKGKLVFENPFVTDEKFQDVWCAFLKSSDDDKKALRKCKGKNYYCAMYYAERSGAKKLRSFLTKKYSAKCKCKN